jgi:hypothetical protein
MPDLRQINLASVLVDNPDNIRRGIQSAFPEVVSTELTNVFLPHDLLRDLLAIICDPKHLAKRLRYRFVSAEFSIGFDPEHFIIFSLERIKGAGFLSLAVFDNSRITKMHDSLPLQLFSPVTFNWILTHPGPELVLTPWCLMIAVLTIPGFNTKTRCDLLETGCWFLVLYEQLLTAVKPPPGVTTNITKEARQSGPPPLLTLYTPDQIRDGLNTFNSLISILRESPTPICLNRLGSDPLEHSFGQARTRGFDLNTMKKILEAFADRIQDIAECMIEALFSTPRRRPSVAVTCGPWHQSPASGLTRTPFEIAISLFDQIGIDRSQILRLPWSEVTYQTWCRPPAWRCLLNLDAFGRPRIGPDLGPSLKGAVFESFVRPRCGPTGGGERLKVLSSDHIFLGILKSPQTDPSQRIHS